MYIYNTKYKYYIYICNSLYAFLSGKDHPKWWQIGLNIFSNKYLNVLTSMFFISPNSPKACISISYDPLGKRPTHNVTLATRKYKFDTKVFQS